MVVLINKYLCSQRHPSLKITLLRNILLVSAEHYGEEFTKINRLQKVPLIDHNGFILTER